jgi:hypothetical protein
MTTLIHQTNPVGFFSSFNTVVGALSYLKKNQISNFYVLWTNGLYQQSDYNLFDTFFYKQTALDHSSIDIAYDAIQIGNVYEAILRRELFLDLHEVLRHYNYFDNPVYKTCLESCAKRPNSIGVHVRRTDHVQHSELLDLNDYFLIVDRKIAESNYDNVYLTTDDVQITTLFKERYGSMLFENENITRSNNGTAIHFNGYSNKEKLALDVMSDALSLSSCDEIVITSSNIAGYALMVNPNIKYEQIDTHKNHY